MDNKDLDKQRLQALVEELLENHGASCMDDDDERAALAKDIMKLVHSEVDLAMELCFL